MCEVSVESICACVCLCTAYSFVTCPGWVKQTRKNPIQWTPCLTFMRATGWGRSRNWIGGGRATPALPAVKRRAAPPATTWTRAAPVLNYPSPCLRPRSRPVSNLRILRMLGVSGITLSPASHSGYDSLTNLTKTAACCWRRQRVCSDRIPSEPGLSDLIQFVCFLFKNEMSVMLNWQKANQLWDSNVGVFRGLGWRCWIHSSKSLHLLETHGAIPLQQFGMPWASSILVMILFCFLELQSCGKNTGCLWMLGGEGFVEPQAHSRPLGEGEARIVSPESIRRLISLLQLQAARWKFDTRCSWYATVALQTLQKRRNASEMLNWLERLK